MTKPVVLKLGGELLDEPKQMKAVAAAIARMARKGPLIVVHGGGKEIDAALAQASIPKWLPFSPDLLTLDLLRRSTPPAHNQLA